MVGMAIGSNHQLRSKLVELHNLHIDALGCLVDGLEGRLGEGESVLKEGRASLQLAWVQIDGAQRAGAQIDSIVGFAPANDEDFIDDGTIDDNTAPDDGG